MRSIGSELRAVVVVSFAAVVVASPGAVVVVSSGVKAAGMVVVLGAFLSLPFPFLLPGRAHLDLVEVVAAGKCWYWCWCWQRRKQQQRV